MQYQGRVLNTWSEIVYDGRGYRLSHVRGQPGCYVLADEAGDDALLATVGAKTRIELRRALPLPLLVMVTMRIADEVGSTAASSDTDDAAEGSDEELP
jgi:hypothetical protein